MPNLKRTAANTQGVRLPKAARAALRAWADLDRFEVTEVPVSEKDGWAAVGELRVGEVPDPWPPRPREEPAKKEERVLDTRIFFGCLQVPQLEDLFDRLFADDLSFVQTGLRRRSRRTTTAGPRQPPLTCRGSFGVDARGALVADSFAYAPLIDFARHVEHFLSEGASLQRAVSQALSAIEARETTLHQAWTELSDSTSGGFADVARLLARVRVRAPDHGNRYVAQWVHPGEEPPGQLPAFYRADLLDAAESPASPLLAAYLAGRPLARPRDAADVSHREHLEPLLDPARLPRASWPGKHLPRLSQQVALTAALAEGSDRLTAINGPPGTGKTTLLRDLYANLVTDRALVLASYAVPSTAFTDRQDLVSMTHRHWSLYPPKPDVSGFEMVVASSNNAAVENVSKQLPSISDIDPLLLDQLHYFRGAANRWTSPDTDDRDDRPGLLSGPAPAWGFAAAALGSRGRVAEFERIVGRYLNRDDDRAHLLRALGVRPQQGEWDDVRVRFQAKLSEVETAIARIAQTAADQRELAPLEARVRGALADHESARDAHASILDVLRTGEDDARTCERSAQMALEHLRLVTYNRPGWWTRLWQPDKLGSWQAEVDEAREAADVAIAAHRQQEGVCRGLRRSEIDARSRRDAAARAAADVQQRLAALRTRLAAANLAQGDEWVDEMWWARHAGTRRNMVEVGTAWATPEFHRLRQELFVLAMQVHEVFARSCGRELGANLRTWMALQSGEVQPLDADQWTLAAWQSLFLVVPLISTTFASMARLMQRVPRGSLGWLIVDEAGQAAPAAAAGGFQRFGRALIVGDPLQLEPVVTLPRALVDELMAHHRAPAGLAPTRTSVQGLADSVSRRGTERDGTWISLPLLVHNRCWNPMFTIANEMAYDGQMVLGRTKPPQPHPLLGESSWLDVPRAPTERDHFLQRDWERVVEVLGRFDWHDTPSVAIISPFKRVSGALSDRLESQLTLLLPEFRRTPAEIGQALQSVRVGTVHTFQGREHDTVILVLGGGRVGARAWAAATPNLLNVAVTRARDRLFVIGDRAAWRDVGYARYLDQRLPRRDS